SAGQSPLAAIPWSQAHPSIRPIRRTQAPLTFLSASTENGASRPGWHATFLRHSPSSATLSPPAETPCLREHRVKTPAAPPLAQFMFLSARERLGVNRQS